MAHYPGHQYYGGGRATIPAGSSTAFGSPGKGYTPTDDYLSGSGNILPAYGDIGIGVSDPSTAGQELFPQFQRTPFTVDPSGIAGFDQFKEFATSTTESPWAIAARQKLGVEESRRKGDIIAQSQGATAQAQSNLAMRGGLSSGARERIQAGGARDVLFGRQNLSGEALRGGVDIGLRDAAAKQGALGDLTRLGTGISEFNVGQETGAQAGNIQTMLDEQSRKFELALEEARLQQQKELAEMKSEDIRAVEGLPPLSGETPPSTAIPSSTGGGEVEVAPGNPHSPDTPEYADYNKRYWAGYYGG